MEIKKLTEQFESLVENKQDQVDLDAVYECLDTLNRAEFWVDTEEEAQVLFNAYQLLKKYYEQVWS